MAGGINKAIIVGHMGSDPDVKYSQNGMAVARFNVATNESWTNKGGNKEERTEWHRIVVFGKLAEICKNYLSKGKQVYVEGRLQTRQWEDRDGNKRNTTEIVANTIEFLGGKAPAAANMPEEPEVPSSGGFTDDDIPF